MGICKSSSKPQEKKSSETPNKSIIQFQGEHGDAPHFNDATSKKASLQRSSNKAKTTSATKVATPTRTQNRSHSIEPSPIRTLKKQIHIHCSPLTNSYSVIPPSKTQPQHYVLVQHNLTGQIRRLTNLKKDEKTVSYANWLVDNPLVNENLTSKDHAHINQTLEIIKDKGQLYFIEEHCVNGSLSTLLTKGPVQESVAAKIVEQLVRVMVFVHSRNYTHNRLTMNSFSLQNTALDFFVKLQDTKNLFQKEKLSLTNTPYLPPQYLENQRSYNPSYDAWSIGIIAFQLLTNSLPYHISHNWTLEELIKEIAKQGSALNVEEMKFSPECKTFLKLAFNREQNSSTLMVELLKTHWLRHCLDPSQKYLKPLYNISQARAVTYCQQCILIFMLGMYDKELLAELEQLFNQLDYGKQGAIKRGELSYLFRKVFANKDIEKEVDQVFERIDTDGSGSISVNEFIVAAIDKQKYITEANIETAFKKLSNANGNVTHKTILKQVEGDEEYLKLEFQNKYGDKLKKDEFKSILKEMILN